MRNMKKRVLCALLSFFMVIAMLPVTASDVSAKTKVDPEVKRAVTLGLVSSSYLKKPTQKATTQELENMTVKIMKKQGASDAKIKAFQKLAKGSKKNTARTVDSMMAAYYAARYLSKDKMPKNNAAMQYTRWIPSDWDAATEYLLTDKKNKSLIHGKQGTFKYYNVANGYESGDGSDKAEWNFVAAAQYTLGLASHYSGQYMIQGNSKGKVSMNQKLTREQLALQMVRFYDSFEPKAKYVSIESLGKKNVISDATIAKAKAVPEVDSTGMSDAYVGTYTQNYCEVGADGSLRTSDDLTYSFRETDFLAMKDMGINYVRLQITCNSYAYPKFSKDRTKLNETIVKDVDNVLKWGMKYGMHISICMMGWVDDDLDGLGSMSADGTKENEITPACLAKEGSWELKTRLLTAFAKRYSNVPAKYLSFELENENSAELMKADGVTTLTQDEMADKYIAMANAVWKVTPERSVSLSTCDTLGDSNIGYWSKIAKAGINLDYHCYEPRAFVAMQPERSVSKDAMVWPNFVDENGETWDMEKVYQVYLKPWQELADQYGVDFKLGENGIFVEGEMLTEPVYQQKYVVAWAKDFAATMKKHKLSYVQGKFMGNSGITSVAMDEKRNPEENGSYIIGIKYDRKTYSNGKYSSTYWVNTEFADALYGR